MYSEVQKIIIEVGITALITDLIFIVGALLVLLGIDYLVNRLRNRLLNAVAIALAATAVVLSFWLIGNNTGSVTMWYLATGFSMTVVLFIMRFFRYVMADYAVMMAGFIIIKRFTPSYYFGEATTMLLVFGMIVAVTRIRNGTLRGNLFFIWFSSLLVSLEGYILGYIFDEHVRMIGYNFDSGLAKLIVWAVAIMVATLLNLLLVYGIKRLLSRFFEEINDMGRRYPRIERYFIYSTIIILATIGALHFAFKLTDIVTDYSLLFNIFTLFTLAIQLSFLIMVFRLTWLRDRLKNSDRENLSLAAYSSGLEKNIDDIKNLKHDIKNIFLTMASFVEKSDDRDMKTFYQEKISPFADDEMLKSDLYAKLSRIDEERLKAFLFYKIALIIGNGIALELTITPAFNTGADPEFTDLIRILGILLDNAAEECLELNDGVIHVKLSFNEQMVSYTIRNSVRPETAARGIRPGISSKGGDRGRGLVIVQDIINNYDRITLNSYFSHDEFVQGLVCYR
jgi:hypothetical protein